MRWVCDPTGEDAPRPIQRWLEERVPEYGAPEKAVTLGIENDLGELLAAASYYNWSQRHKSIEITFASDTPIWITPRRVGTFLSHAFDVCGVNRVTFLVNENNARSRRFVGGLGAKLEGHARQGFFPDDAIIYGMLRSEADPWLMRMRGRDALDLVA